MALAQAQAAAAVHCHKSSVCWEQLATVSGILCFGCTVHRYACSLDRMENWIGKLQMMGECSVFLLQSSVSIDSAVLCLKGIEEDKPVGELVVVSHELINGPESSN